MSPYYESDVARVRYDCPVRQWGEAHLETDDRDSPLEIDQRVNGRVANSSIDEDPQADQRVYSRTV